MTHSLSVSDFSSIQGIPDCHSNARRTCALIKLCERFVSVHFIHTKSRLQVSVRMVNTTPDMTMTTETSQCQFAWRSFSLHPTSTAQFGRFHRHLVASQLARTCRPRCGTFTSVRSIMLLYWWRNARNTKLLHVLVSFMRSITVKKC